MAQAEVDEKREILKRKAKRNRVHLFRGLVSLSTCFYCGKPLPLLGLIVGESQELLVFSSTGYLFMCVGRHRYRYWERNCILNLYVLWMVDRFKCNVSLSAQWVRVCREKLKGLCVRWQVHSHLLLLGMLQKIYCLRFLLAACAVKNQYNVPQCTTFIPKDWLIILISCVTFLKQTLFKKSMWRIALDNNMQANADSQL